MFIIQKVSNSLNLFFGGEFTGDIKVVIKDGVIKRVVRDGVTLVTLNEDGMRWGMLGMMLNKVFAQMEVSSSGEDIPLEEPSPSRDFEVWKSWWSFKLDGKQLFLQLSNAYSPYSFRRSDPYRLTPLVAVMFKIRYLFIRDKWL